VLLGEGDALSSIRVACSMEATPARMAFLIPSGACAWASTRRPSCALRPLRPALFEVNSIDFGLLPWVSTAPVERILM